MKNNFSYKVNIEKEYKKELSRLSKLFDIYADIYNLPVFVLEDENIEPEAFEYALARRYFVILALHDKDGSICFQRTFDTGHLSMHLPGGSIRFHKGDTIINSIVRVAKKSFTKARIADIAPIISLKNRFTSKSGDTCEHQGLGVRALLLNDIKDVQDELREILSKSVFLKTFPIKSIPHPPAKETFKEFSKWLKNKDYSTYTNEIFAQHQVMWRYYLHGITVKPVLNFLSKFFGKYSIKAMKSEIDKRIPESSRVIDVACGDDKSIFDYLDKVDLFVANDISVDQIIGMKKRCNKLFDNPDSQSIVFTNHDCLDLPFKDKTFDIALCRNLLHHLNTKSDVNKMLDNLKRISKNILIVDVENPAKENILGRIRHCYYMKILKDEGKHFYFRDEFEKLIKDKFPAHKPEFTYMPTIKGVYMFAYIPDLVQ